MTKLTKYGYQLFFFFVCNICINKATSQQNVTVNPALENLNHDVHLSPWGPYSKKYAGISHIADMKSGMRFDFTVCPGYYRNKVMVPNVLFESGYVPWKVSADMKSITYRYELEWKDQVYTDITYHTLDSSKVLVEMDCVNNTDVIQNLTLNSMTYIDYPAPYPAYITRYTDQMEWYNAVDYAAINLVTKLPKYHLVTDGKKLDEIRTTESIDGSVLGEGFGKENNDEVTYKLNSVSGAGNANLFFLYRVKEGDTARFQLSGVSDKIIAFPGTGKLSVLKIVCRLQLAGQLILRSVGHTAIELNGFYVSQIDNPNVPVLDTNEKYPTPSITKPADEKNLILKYKDIPAYYGMAWNYASDDFREVLNDELDIYFRLVANNNVTKRFVGNQKGHFTDLFFRPVEVQPKSHRKIYVLLCSGSEAAVKKQLTDFDEKKLVAEIPVPATQSPILPAGKPYQFGNQLLQAALLSNIVYPIYTQRENIRHFTPGKWWNSLYTWDVGFIALGMEEVDLQKSFEIINAYTTEPGNQSAFIHHGSPVPVQFFAMYDLWNRTQSKKMLSYFYPRLKQYFNFMVGITPTSTTRMPSNLLKTWDYFYNSGGWDDYPPQKYLRDFPVLRNSISPVITTAQCIRAAKIMRMCASELGLEADLKNYDIQISLLANALQTKAWDSATGYYSYVMHDAKGEAQKIFRYPKDSSNFNMGLDGVAPLISGIANPIQQKQMLTNLFSPKHLWTPFGITAIDQSASYFRQDGYWNGTVWMPHQWFMWKSMLDMGKADKAYLIAKTALDLWKRETALTYSTYEHFISSSGRGAGWSQFSGLSSPVLNWFASYYKIGQVTTGFEIWIEKQDFDKQYTSYQATIRFDQTSLHERSMLICMNPVYQYDAYLNKIKLKITSPYAGLLQVFLPETNNGGVLSIVAKK